MENLTIEHKNNELVVSFNGKKLNMEKILDVCEELSMAEFDLSTYTYKKVVDDLSSYENVIRHYESELISIVDDLYN